MDAINAATVAAPVKMGEPVIRNILNTGVDICASRTIE
jgi:CxxC motif-containing protein